MLWQYLWLCASLYCNPYKCVCWLNTTSISIIITWRCWYIPYDCTTKLLFKTSVFVGLLWGYEPKEYTQHWTTIGKLEKFNLWSSKLVRNQTRTKTRTQVKTSSFLFSTKIRNQFLQKQTFENSSDTFSVSREQSCH